MKPRRLHRATIFSIFTTAAGSAIRPEIIPAKAEVAQGKSSAVTNPVQKFCHPQDLGMAESIDRHSLLDAEFIDPLAERGAGDAEEFRGLDLVAGSLGQGAHDQFPFGGVDNLEV